MDSVPGEAADPSAAEGRSNADEPDVPTGGGRARQTLEYIARSIAREPDAVTVNETSSGSRVSLTVSAAGTDMGRLIGRGGRVANAIRVLVNAAAFKDNQEAVVDFTDD